MKTILSCFILIFLFQASSLYGQGWLNYVNGEDDYKTIKTNIEQYFKNKGTGKGSGYKHYMRWRYKMDIAFNDHDKLKNFEAIQKENYGDYIRNSKSNNRNTNGNWESMGPYSASGNSGIGRVNCMAYHPTDINTMWIGTPNGGLWKTIDGGVNWTLISNYFTSLGISGIAVDYTNTNIIYVLTGDGDGGDSNTIGVLKTTDGGLNWFTTGLTFGISQLVRGFFIKIHPTDPQILRVGTIQGLYSSLNGGASWVQTISSNWVWDLEYKPDNPSIFYLGTNGGIIKVNGSTYTTYIGTPTAFERIALAVCAAQPNNVYALFGGDLTTPGIFIGFYQSTDGGNSYTPKSTSPNILGWDNGGDAGTQANYDLCVEVNQTDPNRVYVGGVNSWTSNNAGTTWSRMSHWNGSGSPYVHADFHNMYHRNGVLFATNDGGIYKTSDHGSNWTELSAGINGMQFYYIDYYDNTWMGGSQDNGTHSANYGNFQSSELHGGDGFGCTWHNSDHSIQFMTSQNDIVRRQAGTNLYINQVPGAFWFTELSMGTTTNHLFANSGEVLLRGNQNVFIWDWSWPSTGSENFLTDFIRGYQQGTDNPNVMYVVSGSEIIKTASSIFNNNSIWTVLTHPSPGTTLQNVTVDPANSDHVWVVCSGFSAGNKVFKSINGGVSWTNISGTLPNINIRCIVYDSPASDKIYIGTDFGVYFRNSTMTDWVLFSNYLPAAHVTSLKIFGSYIYAGTFGRGIWRSPIYNDCPANLTLTQANDPSTIYTHGTQIHKASNSITNSRIVSGNLGVSATYTAGNYIDFTEGFWAKTNSFVQAKNEGCP